MRSQPGQQYAWSNRLREVVVSTKFQTDHLVDLLPSSGQHDDGSRENGPHQFADFETIASGKIHIENDRVGVPFRDSLDGRVSASFNPYFEIMRRQIVGHHRGKRCVIFHDENAGTGSLGTGGGLRFHERVKLSPVRLTG